MRSPLRIRIGSGAYFLVPAVFMAAWIRLVHVRPINRLDTRSKEKVALFCLLLSVLPFASFSMFFCVAPSSLIFAIFFFLFVFSPETWSESVGLNPVFCAPVAFVQHY
jgi:hypothetical protein